MRFFIREKTLAGGRFHFLASFLVNFFFLTKNGIHILFFNNKKIRSYASEELKYKTRCIRAGGPSKSIALFSCDLDLSSSHLVTNLSK